MTTVSQPAGGVENLVLGSEYPDWFASCVSRNDAVTGNFDSRWSGGPDWVLLKQPSGDAIVALYGFHISRDAAGWWSVRRPPADAGKADSGAASPKLSDLLAGHHEHAGEAWPDAAPPLPDKDIEAKAIAAAMATLGYKEGSTIPRSGTWALDIGAAVRAALQVARPSFAAAPPVQANSGEATPALYLTEDGDFFGVEYVGASVRAAFKALPQPPVGRKMLPLYANPAPPVPVSEDAVEAAVQAVRPYTRATLTLDEHRDLVRNAIPHMARGDQGAGAGVIKIPHMLEDELDAGLTAAVDSSIAKLRRRLEAIDLSALASPPADQVTALVEAREELRKLGRTLEMQANIMRDPARTGGWEGSERVAAAFDRAHERVSAIDALLPFTKAAPAPDDTTPAKGGAE